jgi:iron complex outermembrane receptor protein
MRSTCVLLCAASALALATSAQAAEPAKDDAFALGEIIVTTPRVEGVAIDTHTLTAESIYAFNRNTLDEAVSLVPGVTAANTGGSRNERLIYVRGFNRFQVPLSIDGIRVFLPADNRLDYGRFLTPDMAEIQVAKGYVSVLDGPDGLGGAVNLVTRRPTAPFQAEGRATVNAGRDGEYSGYTAFGLVGGASDRWYGQVSGAKTLQDHTDLPGDFRPTPTENGGERDLSRTEDWRVNLKAGFTPNDSDEYAISYTRQEGEKIAPLSTTDPLSLQRFWSWPYWNLDSLYFLSTTALNDTLTLRTRVYRNTFDNLLRSFDNRNLNTQTLGRAFNSYYEDEAWGASARLDARLSDADTLSVAYHYRRDKHVEWQQSFPTGAVEPKQTNLESTSSVAVENRLALSETLTLTAGASYDWRNLKKAEDFANNAFVYYRLADSDAWNGQAKLEWQVDPETALHASISSRARFPTVFERFSSRFGGAVSNPDLKPERATNFEVGAARTTDRLHLEGAVFYSKLEDAIISVPFVYVTCTPANVCTPNAVSQSRNVGKGDYYGAELSASLAVNDAFTIGANYTYVRRDVKDPNNPLFHPTDVPTHKGFIYADWSPIDRLHVFPNLDLASDRWTANSAGTRYYRTGSYVQANLRVDFDVNDAVTVGLGGRNLFDESYQLVDGFPEPGRSFFASVRARY